MKAKLIYTIQSVETSQGGTLGLGGKTYTLTVEREFEVRPLIGETVRVAGKEYKISTVVHAADGLEIFCGWTDFEYKRGANGDASFERLYGADVAKMKKDGWTLEVTK